MLLNCFGGIAARRPANTGKYAALNFTTPQTVWVVNQTTELHSLGRFGAERRSKAGLTREASIILGAGIFCLMR